MFAMSNVLGFARQERLSSHCRLHVFKTKKKEKKKEAKPVKAEWHPWKKFILKNGMNENWTIRSSNTADIWGIGRL